MFVGILGPCCYPNSSTNLTASLLRELLEPLKHNMAQLREQPAVAGLPRPARYPNTPADLPQELYERAYPDSNDPPLTHTLPRYNEARATKFLRSNANGLKKPNREEVEPERPSNSVEQMLTKLLVEKETRRTTKQPSSPAPPRGTPVPWTLPPALPAASTAKHEQSPKRPHYLPIKDNPAVAATPDDTAKEKSDKEKSEDDDDDDKVAAMERLFKGVMKRPAGMKRPAAATGSLICPRT